MIYRVYVETKRNLDSAAIRLLSHIKRQVEIEKDCDIRLFTRFDLDNVSQDQIDFIRNNILSNPQTQNIYPDLPLTTDWSYFTYSNFLGSYNEEIENVRKLLNLSEINCNISVSYIIALSNILSSSKLEAVKSLVMNPNTFEVIENNRQLTKVKKAKPAQKQELNPDFLGMNDIEVYQYHAKQNFSMSSDELCLVRDYFKKQERLPTLLELITIDSCWAHKKEQIGQYVFKDIKIEDSYHSPIKIALDEYLSARKELHFNQTRHASLDDLAQIGRYILKRRGMAQDILIDENGECTIQFPADVNGVVDQYSLYFKASKILKNNKYDLFSNSISKLIENRAVVYQSGVLSTKTLSNKQNDKLKAVTFEKSEEKFVKEKLSKFHLGAGISTTADQIYSPFLYSNNVFSAYAAAMPKIAVSNIKVETDDVIFILGGRVGFEDCELEQGSQTNNPIIKQKIKQLLFNFDASVLIKKISHFNNSIISGLAFLADGMFINLDQIIKPKTVALDFALDSSNERVAVVVSQKNAQRLLELCSQINLTANAVGVVTGDSKFIATTSSQEIINLDISILKHGGLQTATSVLVTNINATKNSLFQIPEKLIDLPIEEAFVTNLKTVQSASKKAALSMFDSSVNAGSVLAPFGGINQITPQEASVSKIPTKTGNTNTVTAISYGCNPEITAQSAFLGATFSIMESISKIVAVGANSVNTRLSICESFNDPATIATKWDKPVSALLGALSAQIGMDIPIVDNECKISGGVGESDFNFAAFAISTSKANEVISAEFKSTDSTILLIPMPLTPRTNMPDFDKAKVMYRQLHYLSRRSKVLSAGVVKNGGVAALVAQMSFGNGLGVEFKVTDKNILFAPLSASIVVETKDPGAFSGMDTIIIGKTILEQKFSFSVSSQVSLSDALAAYNSKFERKYPTKSNVKIPKFKTPLFDISGKNFGLAHFSKPKVLIPVFINGLNAVDCERAFVNNNAVCDVFYFDHKNTAASIETLVKKINSAQIILLPPENETVYNVNFITNVLNNVQVKEAIITFISQKGLILGLGTGFDALLKTGLLIDGHFNEASEKAVLVPNLLGSVINTIAKVRVSSTLSPWLSLCSAGDIFNVSINHSNGRFIASDELVKKLIENQQIATQYVDSNGKAATKLPFNPNGSINAIEGITSPNGLIFGKMGYNQRRTRDCFVNIVGNAEQRIFESAVKYFN